MEKGTSMQAAHRSGSVGSSGVRGSHLGWQAWGSALLLAAIAAACDPAARGGDAASSDRAAQASGAADDAAASDRAAQASGAEAGVVHASASAASGSSDGSAYASAGNPLGGLAPPAAGQERLVGVVAEHLPAGGYTYLRIEPERGPAQWVVTTRRDVGAGDRVSVDSLGSRHDFYSRRLDRRFAELVFGVVEVVG